MLVVLHQPEDGATLTLAATKTDTLGRGCARTLACSCADAGQHEHEPADLCPVAALEPVLNDRERAGFTDLQSSFAAAHGQQQSPRTIAHRSCHTRTG